jgi:hypothetical protein
VPVLRADGGAYINDAKIVATDVAASIGSRPTCASLMNATADVTEIAVVPPLGRTLLTCK